VAAEVGGFEGAGLGFRVEEAGELGEELCALGSGSLAESHLGEMSDAATFSSISFSCSSVRCSSSLGFGGRSVLEAYCA
jgi:hypothetical protein